MAAKNKSLHEEFARFFEKPSREGLRELLKKHVGELPNCDFKAQWPPYSRLARHLLGFGNSGGGCMIIGVTQKEDKSFDPKGVEELVDKTDILNGVRKFLPKAFQDNFEILDFSYEAAEYPSIIGKKFQVTLVIDDPKHLPFIATDNGDGIRKSGIYVRRGPSTDEANYEEPQRIINRRLETGYSSQREINLETHLEQLKALFRQIDKYHIKGGWPQTLSKIIEYAQYGGLKVTREPNPKYPKEDFEKFIVKMIDRKKNRIARELDLGE